MTNSVGDHDVKFTARQWSQIMKASETDGGKQTHSWVRDLVMYDVFNIVTGDRPNEVGSRQPTIDLEKMSKHVSDMKAEVELMEETLREAKEEE